MRHATDGALVRWIDAECDAAEHTALSRHLEGCFPCRQRLGRVRARSEILRRALRADAPRFRVPRWRTVSVAAAALVAIAAVRPVRAWVVERAGALWAAVTGTQTPLDARAAVTVREGSVSFLPAGDAFVIQVRTRQDAGHLAIEFGDAAVASARILGDAAAAELVVLPAGIRIGNTPNSRASYALRLPATLKAVTVTIADERPIHLEPAPHGRWEGDLTTRSAR
jgi:hypothetical protein